MSTSLYSKMNEHVHERGASDEGPDSTLSGSTNGHNSDDPDSFIIGDRVWVQGSKPGYIQYIGEVKFAKGEWAGVVLDRLEGKNDGSVHGVRYFQCAPGRGLFTRLHRLSRYPLDENGNRVPPSSSPEPITTSRSSRHLCNPSGRVTTTFTRVTSCPRPIPHYALPARPSKIITTIVTTTTTSTLGKPKSALKKNDRIDPPSTRQQHHVHF